MRAPQPEGRRGSLKWIQRAVHERWPALDTPILAGLGGARDLTWLSPLAGDAFAEYRDASFLARIGCSDLTESLKAFWPARGPQWDALGLSDRGDILLVEAKAHVAEMCSPGTAAGPASRLHIERTLDLVADQLRAKADRAPWANQFYQLANRLAHLQFLRAHGKPAWLVLVSFIGDEDMGGPSTAEAWEAAYEVAFHVMGLGRSHPLSRYILHVHPQVGETA